MKRVAAGAHLPTTWVFEPAKRPDDRADYSLRRVDYEECRQSGSGRKQIVDFSFRRMDKRYIIRQSYDAFTI